MSNVCEIIPTLSTTEKLAVMEALWSSLHDTFELEPPPAWHEPVLDERMKLIESGDAIYEDWNQVKNELRARMV
ncbi:MAG: addiction module protein [Verrucomicrobia bacterium]|jgi:hypothetical protein|nr:addiction module protein [Verrucomicrobiota bacterium]|tara:strand:- start:4632 stop:4853 length:222 start_codon:yes stop_codon:yes gene_type:complete